MLWPYIQGGRVVAAMRAPRSDRTQRPFRADAVLDTLESVPSQGSCALCSLQRVCSPALGVGRRRASCVGIRSQRAERVV